MSLAGGGRDSTLIVAATRRLAVVPDNALGRPGRNTVEAVFFHTGRTGFWGRCFVSQSGIS